MAFLSKIFSDSNQKIVKKLEPLVQKINSWEAEFSAFTDEQLKEKTMEFKERLAPPFGVGETLDNILPEAFAAVRESAKRTLGQRHYDVQLIGGIVLHQGKIAEMKTGEGKTLVATLSAYLNALTGKGVHIVTVNDYLSRRDAVWMGQIFHFLGLTVGCINHDTSYLYDPSHQSQISNFKSQNLDEKELDKIRDTEGSFKVVHEFLKPCNRKEAYEVDITYGTNNEFGFDYLRDNLAYNANQISQREHYFAIVDEVDSILIDEARTPLIISAPDADSGELYRIFSRVIPNLKEGDDYTIDEKMKAVSVLESGIEKVEKLIGVSDIYTEKGIKYVHHLEQALRAQSLFKRDKDYVIKDGEIIIVDEFTGRLMPGRRWSEGLHQAIEAKEGVEVKKESRTVATITFQNYFRMYEKLSGMTGTAATSAEEFGKVYNLEVAVIPTNKPLARKDLNDKIFQTEKGKFQAVVNKIKECAERGQPVLVGTVSIEKNEFLSAMLSREGVRHNILNAKNHEKEAEIIAQAGKLGAVTIATNMAGRGVDIALGGVSPPADNEDFNNWQEEHNKVIEAGGLFVIGTERHEARRIDNQLRGRSGRQGDPGTTQFFVSLEDDLMRIFAAERIKNMMGSFGIPEDQPIEHSLVTRSLESAQAKVEGFNFDARKHTLEYDDVMNRHRKKIYETRKKIVFGEAADLEEMFKDILLEEINSILNFYTAGEDDKWNLEELFSTLKGKLNFSAEDIEKIKSTAERGGGYADETRENLKDFLRHAAQNNYEVKKQELRENFSSVLKMLFLQITDMFWVEHLELMEYTRSSVRLRAYGQRDPLVEYKNESVRLFRELERAIKANVFYSFFQVSALPKNARQTEVIENRGNNAAGKAGAPRADAKKIGRNDPCPCGSGKKYKKCHGS